MRILGISAYYHDSAAALIEDGRILAAAQEERFSRRKHDARFPANAIRACLEQAGADSVDCVAFYDKPFLKFERLLETYLAFAPRGFGTFRRAMPVWLKDKLFLRQRLARELSLIFPGFDGRGDRLLFSEHHLSHAASAFFPSPFEEALVLTLDGVGEWATASASMGSGSKLEIFKELHFPHSLGLVYSAFTDYLGFRVNSGEYKVMGLAPYGRPRFRNLILERLLDLRTDGSFRVRQENFDYCTGARMWSRQKFEELFGIGPRGAEEPLLAAHMDLAASIQAATEEVVLRMTSALARETGARQLCLAGGVALNCVANGKILRDRAFDRIWIQPAAGDAGGALGAALAAHHLFFGKPRFRPSGGGDSMAGAYLGPSFSQEEIERRLRASGAVFEVLSDEELFAASAQALVSGQALGWFQGRMEFGPRALGGRSILADPRSPGMQKKLNLQVKFRESFRPFAPAVLREDLEDWFELDVDSPYMLLVADVSERHRLPLNEAELACSGIEQLSVVRSEIPAVTHVDYSARVQSVHVETNARFHHLIQTFKTLTGCPVLANTSFNVRGEPIVGTPENAFRCFLGTEIEALAIGNCFLRKAHQTREPEAGYERSFSPD